MEMQLYFMSSCCGCECGCDLWFCVVVVVVVVLPPVVVAVVDFIVVVLIEKL